MIKLDDDISIFGFAYYKIDIILDNYYPVHGTLLKVRSIITLCTFKISLCEPVHIYIGSCCQWSSLSSICQYQ